VAGLVIAPPGPRIRCLGAWNGRRLCKAPGVLFGAEVRVEVFEWLAFFVGPDDFGHLDVKYLDIQVENP